MAGQLTSLGRRDCVACNGSRVLFSGPYRGALWCVVKSTLRSPTFTCDLWQSMPLASASAAELGAGSFPHHVLVNSGVGCQFGSEPESGNA